MNNYLEKLWTALFGRASVDLLADLDVCLLTDRIGRSELFCNASADLLQSCLSVMTKRAVKAGEEVVREGQRGGEIIVLVEGRARVTRQSAEESGERVLADIAEPTLLGEEAFLGSGVRPATVTMQSDGVLLSMSRKAFVDVVGRLSVSWVDTQAACHMRGGQRRWLLFDMPEHGLFDEPGIIEFSLVELRSRMTGLDQDLEYFCCARDDGVSVIAAFLLSQRGFQVRAVRQGRSLIENWRRRAKSANAAGDAVMLKDV